MAMCAGLLRPCDALTAKRNNELTKPRRGYFLDKHEAGAQPAQCRSSVSEWLSYQGLTVNALALGGDEGRGRLRKASGSRQQAIIRGHPNGATQHLL